MLTVAPTFGKLWPFLEKLLQKGLHKHGIHTAVNETIERCLHSDASASQTGCLQYNP